MAADPASLLPSTTNGPWSLRNLKTLRGEETPHFEAILCRDGEPFCLVENDGRGGCSMYRRLGTYEYDPALQAAVDDYAKTLPAVSHKFGSSAFVLAEDADTVVFGMVEAHSLLKALKRDAKTKLVVHHPDDERGEFRLAPLGRFRHDDPKVREAVLARHPGAVILNDVLLGGK